MIKVKMTEILGNIEVLSRISNCDSTEINSQFKSNIIMLNKCLMEYSEEYYKSLQELINKYEIKVFDGNFISKDENNLKEFLKSNYELLNEDIEINKQKIVFDSSFNRISGYDLMTMMPFFDYSEINC